MTMQDWPLKRSLRMARDLRHLPWRQLGVDVLGQLLALLVEAVDLFGDVDGRIVLHEAQLFNFGIELGNRLLEIEESCFSHCSSEILFPTAANPQRG
jgi:hypothetical protein